MHMGSWQITGFYIYVCNYLKGLKGPVKIPIYQQTSLWFICTSRRKQTVHSLICIIILLRSYFNQVWKEMGDGKVQWKGISVDDEPMNISMKWERSSWGWVQQVDISSLPFNITHISIIGNLFFLIYFLLLPRTFDSAGCLNSFVCFLCVLHINKAVWLEACSWLMDCVQHQRIHITSAGRALSPQKWKCCHQH